MAAVGVLTVGREPFRRAARAVVDAAPGFESLAEAGSAEEALESALPLRPRVVLVGAEMPVIDGLETSRRLNEAVPESVVILVYENAKPEGAATAAAVVHQDDLDPVSLRKLWEEHGPQ